MPPYRPIQRQQKAKKPVRWQSCPTCGASVNRRSKDEWRDVGRGFPAPYHSCQLEADMTEGTIPDPFAEVPRDRYMRPLIIPAGGGKPVAYTRCTTFVGVLEDTFNLSKWQQRMVALGLTKRPDLLLAVSAHSDDKKRLDGICDEAREAAAASSAATTGTALHKLTERVDRGENVDIPKVAKADVNAYLAALDGMDRLHIEALTVHDELKVAGTPDRVLMVDGTPVIADLKTGSIDFGIGKIAMQLAMYSRSLRYELDGTRHSLDVDQDRALVIHLPAGSGECKLVWVDIRAGWEAVQVAAEVRAWRARKNLATPYAPAQRTTSLSVARLILEAPDEATLRQIWADHRDVWSDDLTKRAAARKAELAGLPTAS